MYLLLQVLIIHLNVSSTISAYHIFNWVSTVIAYHLLNVSIIYYNLMHRYIIPRRSNYLSHKIWRRLPREIKDLKCSDVFKKSKQIIPNIIIIIIIIIFEGINPCKQGLDCSCNCRSSFCTILRKLSSKSFYT